MKSGSFFFTRAHDTFRNDETFCVFPREVLVVESVVRLIVMNYMWVATCARHVTQTFSRRVPLLYYFCLLNERDVFQ